MVFKSLDDCIAFFNMMMVENGNRNSVVHNFFKLFTAKIDSKTCSMFMPVTILVGSGGDFFIFTDKGVFMKAGLKLVYDANLKLVYDANARAGCGIDPLPEQVVKLLVKAADYNFVPTEILMVIADHRISGKPSETFEETYIEELTHLEKMLALFV